MRDILAYPCVGGYYRVMTDGYIPEKSCIGIDCHIIFDCRMAFHSGIIVLIYRQRAKRHSLIKLHIVSDYRSFTDDNAGSMVNKEIFADDSPCINVNAGLAAARQICRFFATGCRDFQVNK